MRRISIITISDVEGEGVSGWMRANVVEVTKGKVRV